MRALLLQTPGDVRLRRHAPLGARGGACTEHELAQRLTGLHTSRLTLGAGRLSHYEMARMCFFAPSQFDTVIERSESER